MDRTVASRTPVDVWRTVEASPWDAGGVVLLGIATAAIVAAAVSSRHARAPLRLLLAIALGASLLEAFVHVPAADGISTLVGDRRTILAIARVVLLTAAFYLAVEADRTPPCRAAHRPAPGLLAIVTVALLTVPPALPGAGSPTGLLIASALTLGFVCVVALSSVLALRHDRIRIGGTVALALLLGTLGGVAAVPERNESPHLEQLTVDGITFDLTVAPVQTGRNELHLYAWQERDPIPLDRVEAVVTSPGSTTRTELAIVTPNHHLSYELMLPDRGPWELELIADRSTKPPLHLHTRLEWPCPNTRRDPVRDRC